MRDILRVNSNMNNNLAAVMKVNDSLVLGTCQPGMIVMKILHKYYILFTLKSTATLWKQQY